MVSWRPHKEDGFCDAARCRKPTEQTHRSSKREYSLCADHAEAGINCAIEDNREVRK